MATYTIELNYDAKIQVCVEAENEGEALDKARDIAEIADMQEFTITREQDSKIISTI